MFGQEIARGAELLDERWPGWRDKIDVERLDMSSTVDDLHGQLGLELELGDAATAHGFDVLTPPRQDDDASGPFHELHYRWRCLTLEWQAALRRAD